MPEVRRNQPPYVQIADAYRRKIDANEIPEGTRLPPAASIATEWNVAPATAHKALKQLASEHRIRIVDKQGAWVTGRGTDALPDRVLRSGSQQSSELAREEVTEAGLVIPHEYVADLLGVDATAHVVRRESIAFETDMPVTLSVAWLPGDIARQIPELLSAEPLGTTIPSLLEERIGRTFTRGRDWFKVRKADAREAAALRIAVGDPILAATSLWGDAQGNLEYYEYVAREEHVVNYGYEIPSQAEVE